jgi:hypothetical protein
MPQPAARNQVPARILTEYTISDPHFTPPTSAGVPAPIAGSNNPTTYVLVTDDYKYTYALGTTIPSATTLTITQKVPLTNIPPVVVPSGYLMDLHTIPWVDSQITGLVPQGVSSIGVVAVSGVQFQGESFGPGTYTAFAVNLTIRMFNATAAAINAGTLVFWVYVSLEYFSGYLSAGV